MMSSSIGRSFASNGTRKASSRISSWHRSIFKQLATRVVPSAHLPVIEYGKGCAYRLVQGSKVVEDKPLDVGIYTAVHQLYGILYQSLVLGTSGPGREDGHVIELSHAGKVLVDDRLIAVAAGYGRLEVVRDDGHGCASEEMERILARGYQVLLLLGPGCLAIGIVAAWQDGNEHLHLAHFASLGSNGGLDWYL